MVKDVVCGMGVEKDAIGTFSRRFEGKQYFFCSVECLLLFSRNPALSLAEPIDVSSSVRDLVCGMDVDSSNPPFLTHHNGRTYYFCSQSCRSEFERDPSQFVERDNASRE